MRMRAVRFALGQRSLDPLEVLLDLLELPVAVPGVADDEEPLVATARALLGRDVDDAEAILLLGRVRDVACVEG